MKIMSNIFICAKNMCCFEILNDHGTKYQIDGMPKIGCIDCIFTIKNLLSMIMTHNLPTFVAFSNIVKDFDTSSHELLIKVLEKYKAPPKWFSGIHRIYQDLIVVLNIENSIEENIQEVGVRKKDNMAHVLFIFFTAAFDESLEDI